MLINSKTTIKGKNVILVPYRPDHVLKYHEWMKSEELQKLTASEPLSLEQEYIMQKTWQRDENKITFIVLHREKYESTANEVDSGECSLSQKKSEDVSIQIEDAMIGDTNLFFATPEDRICAEAEIMIAEPWARGRKCGWEAMLLMFMYAIIHLEVKQFVVKVSFENIPSINMFKNMGFIELSRSEVFQEITFSKLVDDTWKKWMGTHLGDFRIIND